MNPIAIEILGTGCKKCQQLEANAKEAVAALNLEAAVLHITDPIKIAKRSVMSTPSRDSARGDVFLSDGGSNG
ncbi:MAG: thioredoxin family protein [Chamaesiphon sp.]|nr:thioredoxin family protein [Chamaesiphon sp.]